MTTARTNATGVGDPQYQITARSAMPMTASATAQRLSRGISSSAIRPPTTRGPTDIVYGEPAVAAGAFFEGSGVFRVGSAAFLGGSTTATFSRACSVAWA